MPILWCRNSSQEILPKRNGNICPYKDLYKNAYSSCICNTEITYRSFPVYALNFHGILV